MEEAHELVEAEAEKEDPEVGWDGARGLGALLLLHGGLVGSRRVVAEPVEEALALGGRDDEIVGGDIMGILNGLDALLGLVDAVEMNLLELGLEKVRE